MKCMVGGVGIASGSGSFYHLVILTIKTGWLAVDSERMTLISWKNWAEPCFDTMI